MEFLIADTFTVSLAKLNGQEQKAVKTTVFDLQVDPAHPGMQLHRIDRSRDPDFWSIRVSRDLRIIVHKTAGSFLLCYVDRHDAAYRWAERRKIERHPKTGAAQLVEVRERIEEVVVPLPGPDGAEDPDTARLPSVFADVDDDDLLRYGVPQEWLADVRAATEDSLLDLVDHLPQEAAEALLELATGGVPAVPEPIAVDADAFSHPDAQRRFRVLTDLDELQRALEYPWEQWAVFLHPAQRQIAERAYSGPARISGSAGTGKTVVALHRAVILARRNPGARVLLTTFSQTLANALRVKLGRLVGNEPAVHERITVRSIGTLAQDLYASQFERPTIASPEHVRQLLTQAAAAAEGHGFGEAFLFAEWSGVVDAWQLGDWQAYRDVPRLGRKTRIGGKQRETLWAIFARMRRLLAAEGLVTRAAMLGTLAARYAGEAARPFDFAVVDEAQDIGIPELRFLAAIAGVRPDSLFFTGDLGQRIFQQPFSWTSLGVDIRGRSHTLRVNYRTSHQIRRQADRLLPNALADVDGVEESRRGTVSVFNGPPPEIAICDDPEAEIARVAEWLRDVVRNAAPHEIGVFVRGAEQLDRARRAVVAADLEPLELTDEVETRPGAVSITTMHLAKGLEFKAVTVMACDDEVIPSQARIEAITDASDLEDVYVTERHLLYVACTRARDRLLITGVEPASEFLDDLSI